MELTVVGTSTAGRTKEAVASGTGVGAAVAVGSAADPVVSGTVVAVATADVSDVATGPVVAVALTTTVGADAAGWSEDASLLSVSLEHPIAARAAISNATGNTARIEHLLIGDRCQ
jgi:hypothetical protein